MIDDLEWPPAYGVLPRREVYKGGKFVPTRKDGFTLIELMVVVFIIAILAGLSLIYFSTYREMAQAKDLVTVARGCAASVIGECVMGGGNINLSTHTFGEECDKRTLDTTGEVTVSISGSCSDFVVEAVGSKLTHYKGECTGDYEEKIECEIVKK